MYSYKYTLEVTSWSQNAQEYIVDLVKAFNIVYNIEQSPINPNEVILTIKGEKEELDKLEFKLIKNLSSHANIEDFTKTTTKLSEDILVDNNILDMDICEFKLHYKSEILEEDAVAQSIKLLKSQKVGLIKNTNGYYLSAIASKSSPVKKIRELLAYKTKPLPLLVKSSFQASKFVVLGKKDEALLNSDIKPFLKCKKKNIHRLEKIKNTPVNSVAPANIYYIKLPKNQLEELFAEEVNIPLVFIKIEDYMKYIDNVDFFLTFEKNFLEYDDSYMQVIYGKSQIIKLGFGHDSSCIELDKSIDKNIVCSYKNSTAVAYENCLTLSPYGMEEKEFFILNRNFQEDIRIEKIYENSIALVHSFESGFDSALVFEFSTNQAKIFLWKDSKLELKYSLKNPPKTYFDKTVLKSGLTKELNFSNESQLYCDNSYEICFEKSFDYVINNDTIDIDLSKELNKNEICSTLLNTFTDIIKDFEQKYQLPTILCGDLFENKNLTENIIEYFDDNNLDFYLSEKIPLNESCIPLGTILDNIIKS